jgi:hypothetical protein
VLQQQRQQACPANAALHMPSAPLQQLLVVGLAWIHHHSSLKTLVLHKLVRYNVASRQQWSKASLSRISQVKTQQLQRQSS